jgi:hypothetical protein
MAAVVAATAAAMTLVRAAAVTAVTAAAEPKAAVVAATAVPTGEMAKLFCMQFVLHADMLFLQRSAVLYLAEHFRENGRHFPFNN